MQLFCETLKLAETDYPKHNSSQNVRIRKIVLNPAVSSCDMIQNCKALARWTLPWLRLCNLFGGISVDTDSIVVAVFQRVTLQFQQ